ncbi:MAG TPA: TonB family protein [Ignavibacteriaceae bacterium]|nr:TonB family protein [Ignavibacteriaceae bacterium]
MEKEKALELIKLEVLGCLDAQDASALSVSKQTDKYFPWKGLGEYQNLIALLPISLTLEQAPANLKESIVQKIVKVKEEIESRKPKPVVKEEREIELKEPEKTPEPKPFSGPIPFKDPDLAPPPPPVSKERTTQPAKEKETKIEPIPIVHKEREHNERVNKEPVKPLREEEEEPVKTASSKKTMLMAAAGVFVIVAGIFAYLNFSGGKTQESQSNLTKNVVKAPPQNLSSTENINQTQNVVPVKEETKTVQKNEQPPLPKAPSPIEAPISALEEYKKKEVKKETEEVKKPEIKQPVVETKKEVVETKVPLTPPTEEKKTEEEPLYFVAVEDMPEPIGGIQAIQNKIVYPDIAKRAGVKGKVFVLAFVDEQGNVTKTVVQKGLGAGLDEAAEDAIKQTKFKPGMQRGKPVKVQVMIPIVFKLQ